MCNLHINHCIYDYLFMTYKEFRRQLGKAGLTVKDFAGLVKQTPNSITNHASQGQVPSNLAIIATLMGEMAEANLDYRTALSRIEIKQCRPRGNAAKGSFGGNKQINLELSSQKNTI